MAVKLMQYYKYITDEKGMEGKTELARLTMIPSILAGTKPDDDEYIKKFQSAVEQITGKPAPRF